jgi:hypothetical protein
MVMTVGSSDSIKHGNLAILSLPSSLPPVAAEAPLLSLNLLDGEISTSNKMVDGEITRLVKYTANTTGSVETIMDTTTNAGGTTANPLPPDQVLGYHWLKVDVMVNPVKNSPAVHTAKTTGGVETNMDIAKNEGGNATNPLPPDSDTLQKVNNTSNIQICPSNTNTQTYMIKHQFAKQN